MRGKRKKKKVLRTLRKSQLFENESIDDFFRVEGNGIFERIIIRFCRFSKSEKVSLSLIVANEIKTRVFGQEQRKVKEEIAIIKTGYVFMYE